MGDLGQKPQPTLVFSGPTGLLHEPSITQFNLTGGRRLGLRAGDRPNPPSWATDSGWRPKVYQNRELGPGAVYGGGFAAMELTTILNRCHHFRGFVYEHARFSTDKKSIEVVLRPRKGSAAVCSRCHLPAPGYDQLAERRFEFIPLWGFFVFLLYAMRRVDCRRCGMVAVEEVPWGDGKRTLTRSYVLFLARWARRLSWKETAECFSHFLGQGVRCGRTCRHLGTGAPRARPDRRDRRR